MWHNCFELTGRCDVCGKIRGEEYYKNMENKYNLTLEQNIFLAKRNIIDNIYANARMEGLNITFPQTKPY